MAEIEEDIEELDYLDLNEMISGKNKTMKNIDKNLLSSTISKKKLASSANNYQENALFKVTRSFEADVNNYLKETEEANLMLSDDFIITKDPNNKDKEKESLTELCKSTIQRAKQNQSNSNDENLDSGSLMSTLKIDKEKQAMNQSVASSYTSGTGGSIISSITEGLAIGSYTFDGAVKISKLLGEGAQAKVYLGVTEDEDDEENSEQLIMAIKHFSFDTGKQKDAINKEIDALVNKCQTLKELSHDNIIQYFDCESEYKEESQNFIVNIAMEYQETNLTEFMKNYAIKNKNKTLPINLIARITKKNCRGINIFT